MCRRQVVQFRLVVRSNSSSLPTRMNPVHASRVTTTRLVPLRRCLLGSTLAASGPSLQRSSAIMCEDNSRFHSNSGWVDHPCEERARVLLGCTVDRALRESRANFEILFASLDCLRDASVIELVHQLKTRGYFGAKFWLRIIHPRSQRILDLRPLNRAEAVCPCRETVSLVMRTQLLQR